MRSRYRDLAAYRHAEDLADDLYRVVSRWSAFDQWTTGMQLVRAADSIGANIAEAAGRWQPKDKKRLLVVARGSLYETEHWLARAAKRELLDDVFSDRLDEIARPLSGLIDRQRTR